VRDFLAGALCAKRTADVAKVEQFARFHQGNSGQRKADQPRTLLSARELKLADKCGTSPAGDKCDQVFYEMALAARAVGGQARRGLATYPPTEIEL